MKSIKEAIGHTLGIGGLVGTLATTGGIDCTPLRSPSEPLPTPTPIGSLSSQPMTVEKMEELRESFYAYLAPFSTQEEKNKRNIRSFYPIPLASARREIVDQSKNPNGLATLVLPSRLDKEIRSLRLAPNREMEWWYEAVVIYANGVIETYASWRSQEGAWVFNLIERQTTQGTTRYTTPKTP